MSGIIIRRKTRVNTDLVEYFTFLPIIIIRVGSNIKNVLEPYEKYV